MNESLELLPARGDPDSLYGKWLPLVKKIARAIWWQLPPWCSLEEMIADGLHGLVEADQRYDPRKAPKDGFTAWASIYIRGFIRNGLARWDHAQGLPKGCLRMNATGAAWWDRGRCDKAFKAVDDRDEIEGLMTAAGMPIRERNILRSVCLDGRTDKDVARTLGLTRQRVTQLRNEAVAQLKGTEKRQGVGARLQ